MKKSNIFYGACMALTMAVCACDSQGSNAADAGHLSTDSVKFEQKDAKAEISLKADYPTAANTALANVIAEYISEQMGGTYAGSLANGDSLINYYGKAQKDSLNKERSESGVPEDVPFFYSCEVKKGAETSQYVTYTSYTEAFLGGAHGNHSTAGVTFRKSDGRKFGYDMLRNTDSDAFHALIKEGIKSYFNEQGSMSIKTDEQLKEMLIVEDDVNYLPLPRTAPYLNQDGVTFIYQAYEIAPYAAGTPTFTVPFSKIRLFLTETVAKMLK